MVDFESVFGSLRQIMLDCAGDQVVSRDAPGDLVVRTLSVDPKTKEPGWFGTVTIKKNYVAYHLMPLYHSPSLAESISGALAKRRQGKSCFNFATADPALFEELAVLTMRARATLP